ncbi:cationic amino acid transporter 2 [Pyrus ussuriensis x Pyrus communis]|uniref:Cationic amino acid transporter 2 n=1 Tax=Pyrus ussuriensis x Pyrus communis TaxID=2448454 RepID=A0A5N5HUW0_9ROSA|nr:cationic amino acid transporter 2 [Pyrus ussuriensis x Pyrus communis]
MGLLVDSKGEGGGGGSGRNGGSWGGRHSLIRRKQVDSVHVKSGGHQLAKELTVPHLVAIGVGSTIGAGVYILVGTVAREHSGPALAISFLIAGIAAALSAFCYAELASRCPSAGSAYHYTYICIGEGVAWLVGWALILEYTIGGSAVARGISPNLALLFGGEDSLPAIIARQHIPALGLVVDPCAAILVFIVTGLLCVGIKESTVAQGIVTIANVCAMIFVVVAGTYLGFKSGWTGYELPTGYFPFGVNGMLAGSATVFFAYIGFDSVASTAEEVKNPQRDLPLGIGAALSICCALYMLVSMVIVGLVPYYAMDPDTPISSAFASHGMQWAAYVITVGAVTALCSTLMGSILPQPRILMAMSRDGLLPPFFADINKKTQVPVKSTIATGICCAVLAFFMDVSQLAGMVSVGTLVAFTMVAISVLILRYVPPDEVPMPSSLRESIDSVWLRHGRNSQEINVEDPKTSVTKPLLEEVNITVELPLIKKQLPLINYTLSEAKRRKIAGWTIMFTCVGVLLLTYSASDLAIPSFLRYTFCGGGGILLLLGLIVLTCIDQDDARHTFGHTGGFLCPFVPLLPIICILINVYLLINLGADTWARVAVWLLIGVVVYVFYGRSHSSLEDAVYVPVAHADEIFRSSETYVA